MGRTAFLAVAGILSLSATITHAGEVPVKIKTYSISGTTGRELYESIGENGPKGGGHVAQTAFKLTWNRLFDERGGDCYLIHAGAKLAITQTYPKPSSRLSTDMKRRWDKFIAATKRHEDAHIDMIREMVRTTEASLAGSVERHDRTCAKVKKQVSAKIDQAYEAHRVRSRAFDKAELSPGGPMFRVLEDFVNER